MSVILFVREDLLKASHYKTINVKGHMHSGTWIDAHAARVLVADDHDDAKVATGRGSFYQQQAHRVVSGLVSGFADMPHDESAAIVLKHATLLQQKASASAALSGWKKEALAGRNPKPSMWAAFYGLDSAGKTALLIQVSSRVGDTDHLHAPSRPVADPIDEVRADAQVAAAPAQVPDDPVASVDSGPIEGDTKPGADGSNLVFRHGRWHRYVNADEHGELPPVLVPVAQAEPAPQAEPPSAPEPVVTVPTADMRVRLASVPPPDLSGLSNSETNEGVRRRLAALHALVDAGDRDGIEAFTTSRSRANYALVANYRDALLVAATSVSAAQIAQAVADPVPQPPVISGTNELNTAMLAARRKVRLLYEAAIGADPVPSILAIPTSRGNGYLNRASDYKQQLLNHFGHQADGSQAIHTAEVAAHLTTEAVPVVETPPPVAPAAVERQAPSVVVVRDPEMVRLALPDGAISQKMMHNTTGDAYKFYEITVYPDRVVSRYGRINTRGTTKVHQIADTRLGGRAAKLYAQSLERAKRGRGYVFRQVIEQPPVAATSPTPEQASAPAPAASPVPDSQNPLVAANPMRLSEADLGFVPRPNVPLSERTNDGSFHVRHPEMAALNRRYLAQNTSLQSRAREYQAGSWVPETPESRAIAAQARAEASRREMEAIRAAAVASAAAVAETAARMGAVPDLYKPKSPVGANVTQVTGDFDAVGQFLNVPGEIIKTMAKMMIADFGGTETFKIRVSGNRDVSIFSFCGSNGSTITRSFRKHGRKFQVHHDYFSTPVTGTGASKNVLRCSMGVYKTLGVDLLDVNANIDIGSYTWANFGFVPINWNRTKQEILERMEQLKNVRYSHTTDAGGRVSFRPLSPKDHQKVLNLLSSSDPKTLWAFVDMEVGGRKVGKEIMVGHGHRWNGAMDLTSPDAMARFDHYVATTRS